MDMIKKYIINQRFLISLFIGCILGTLFANIFGVKYISTWGIFNSDYFEKYSSVVINGKGLWIYIIKNRVQDIVLLGLLCMTPISIPAIMGYVGYMGASMGLVISVCSMQYGFFGLIIYLVSVFPQYIFYGLALFVIIKAISSNSNYKRYNDRIKKLGIAAIVMLLMVLGSVGEAFVNPGLMQGIINNIM